MEKSWCFLNCGIIDGVEEMEKKKKKSHQRGWSEVSCEHFSSWKFQVAALSSWKFLSCVGITYKDA